MNKNIINFKKNIKPIKNYIDINKENLKANLYVYDDIDEYLVNILQNEIINGDNNIDCLNIHINSFGGDVMQGTQLINMILKKKEETGCIIKVYIDGWAVSMASVLAIAIADELILNKASLMMIHLPLCNLGYSNRLEIEKVLEFLNKNEKNIFNIYREKIGEEITDEEIITMMENETWLDIEDIKRIFSKVNIKNSEDKAPIYNKVFIDNMQNTLKIPSKIIDSYKQTLEEEKLKISNEFLKEYLKANDKCL